MSQIRWLRSEHSLSVFGFRRTCCRGSDRQEKTVRRLLAHPGRPDEVAWVMMETHCRNGQKILGSILLRQQPQALDVARAYRAIMAGVEARRIWLVQALDYAENCGVDESDIGVGIAVAHLSDPPMVLGNQLFAVYAPAVMSSGKATRTPG